MAFTTFFRTTLWAGGSRKELKCTTLSVQDKNATPGKQEALFFLCLPWLQVKQNLPAS